ncbi:MAG: HAD hydrolase-like protein [Comamonas sp.]
MSSVDSIIVLDIDGTVTDSVRPHQIAFEKAIQSFDFPELSTEWGKYKHHSDSGILREAWEKARFPGQPDLLKLEKNYKIAYDGVKESFSIKEIAGARTFIARMQGAWNIVFATGSLRYGAEHKLSILGLDVNDLILVTASEFSTREELVREAVLQGCAQAKIKSPRRVISIGDGVWDLKTAQNLGYEFVGMGQGTKAAQLSALNAPVYADFDALLADPESIFAADCFGKRMS